MIINIYKIIINNLSKMQLMENTFIKNLIDESESGKRQISVEEMNFMRHFINNRLSKLKNQNFNPQKC